MDSNNVHRHKHRHMHTHHFRYIARICMFRCMFRIVCLDEWLGFILRKIIFPKNLNKLHSNILHNKPWGQNPIEFSFYFLNQISTNFNHTLTCFCKITNYTSPFHKSHALEASFYSSNSNFQT